MDIKLPKLGEGADSGAVVNILVQEGDQVEKDQTLIELENEKAVAPIPSTAAGKITKIYVKEGEQISVGQRIVALSGGEEQEQEQEQEKEKVQEAEEEDEGEEGQKDTAASPTIRRMARQLGINLLRVRGSGRGGRIVLEDLRAYIQRLQSLDRGEKRGKEVAVVEKVDFGRWGEVERKPMSPLRKAISRKMTASWTTVPHVTQFGEADVTGLLAMKKRHEEDFEKQGVRLTLTPLLILALLPVLRKYPQFNASLDEETIVLKQYYHIGIAVDTEAGLIVPVIHDADRKSPIELARALQEVAEKARQRKLAPEEMRGGSFTISNQGGAGGGAFTPVINVPEVAILGVGRGRKTAGSADSRTILPLCLSYDHRVIDGADAARFITDFISELENFAIDLL